MISNISPRVGAWVMMVGGGMRKMKGEEMTSVIETAEEEEMKLTKTAGEGGKRLLMIPEEGERLTKMAGAEEKRPTGMVGEGEMRTEKSATEVDEAGRKTIEVQERNTTRMTEMLEKGGMMERTEEG